MKKIMQVLLACGLVWVLYSKCGLEKNYPGLFCCNMSVSIGGAVYVPCAKSLFCRFDADAWVDEKLGRIFGRTMEKFMQDKNTYGER